MNKLNTKTESSYFAYGDDIEELTLLSMDTRVPIVKFLSTGLPDEAIGRGFDIIDNEGAIVENNEEIQKLLDKNFSEIMRAITFERLLGDSILVVFSMTV